MRIDHTLENTRKPTSSFLDEALGHALAFGIAAVLLIQAARGVSATFGWLPLWLLGMPLAGLVTRRIVRGPNATQFTFRWPRLRSRRPSQPQARRRGRGSVKRSTHPVA